MPQLACETDLDDLSGMLSLNSDAEEQIYAHIRAGFNALMQRSHDVDVADGSDSFTETPELLNSLLENLIKVPPSSENLNVLTKCLSIIQESSSFLTQDINNHLVELLHANYDPECNKDICQILLNSEYQLSGEQEQKLNDLLNKSSTEHLLNLLIEKEILSIEAVENIILSIKANANNEENNNLHANQLIILAKSFDKYPELKQKFQQPILDFFKEYDDSELLAQIFRSIGDKGFFDPINQKLQQKFHELSVLLEIERAVHTIKLEKKASEEVKQRLAELTNKDGVLISQNSYQLLSRLGIILPNADSNYTLLGFGEWIKVKNDLEKNLTQLLKYQIRIDPNIRLGYEACLSEILKLKYKVPEEKYKTLLQDSTDICCTLLSRQNNLSESSIQLLISSLDKYKVDIVDHVHNVSSIMAILIAKGQLPEESKETAIKLLTTYTGRADKHVVKNISYCFKNLASDNIENNAFTEAICQQHLGSNVADKTILQGLEYIINNKGELPFSCISNLVEFSLNDEANDQDRCDGLQLIARVINQVTQEDIIQVLKLFNCSNGSNELPDAECNLQAKLQSIYLVTLEEIKLDKYLAEQGLKIQQADLEMMATSWSDNIFSNRFFESISVQLASLGQVKSAEDIYQMTMQSLRLASGETGERSIIPLQEYYTSMSGDMPSGEIIQAASDILGVDISIYNYDGSACEIISSAESIGERVKIQIGATNKKYFSLVRDNINYSVATTDQSTISSDASYDNVLPVFPVILKAGIRLIEAYAKEYNMLPTEVMASLKLLIKDPLLKVDIVNILNHLMSVSPGQLDAELLDSITDNKTAPGEIGEFDKSIFKIKTSHELEKLKIDKDIIKTQLKDLNKTHQLLKEELGQLKTNRDAKQAELDDLFKKYELVKEELAQLEIDKDAKQQQLEDLSRTNKLLQEELEQFKGNRDNKQAQLDDLLKTNKLLHAELAQLKIDRDAKQKQLDDLLKTNKALNAEYKQLGIDRNAKKAQLDALMANHSSLWNELNTIKANIDSATAQMNSAKAAYDHAVSSLQQCQLARDLFYLVNETNTKGELWNQESTKYNALVAREKAKVDEINAKLPNIETVRQEFNNLCFAENTKVDHINKVNVPNCNRVTAELEAADFAEKVKVDEINLENVPNHKKTEAELRAVERAVETKTNEINLENVPSYNKTKEELEAVDLAIKTKTEEKSLVIKPSYNKTKEELKAIKLALYAKRDEINLENIPKFKEADEEYRAIKLKIEQLLNNTSAGSATDQEDNSPGRFSLELEKIQASLEGNGKNAIGLNQLRELYNLFEYILKKEPESSAAILSIIRFCKSGVLPDSGTIGQLIDLKELTFADQCRLVKYGCRLDKLHKAVEEYFNNNLELIANDINALVMAVDVIGILSPTTDLSPETISSLIKIAGEETCSNKEYILKIIQKQNHVLKDLHFVELEELFPFLKPNLRLLLAKLFVNNSKQVASGPGIDAILEEFTDSNATLFTSILPESAGQVGQIIVKLKSDIDVDDKLSALNELAALVSDNKERFITDFAILSFATQQQADQLRENFSQIYQEQLQYNDKAREVIRENHYPELEEIKNIIGESRYNIKSLTRQESLDSTSEPNMLGIDISLPHQINKGIYQYNYIITATNDCTAHDILDLLSQRLCIDKARLIQSPDNERTITIDKSLLENTINLCSKLSIEAINQRIQLPETQPKNTQELNQASEVIDEESNISMTDKNYWYNETDIQYIANGLVTEHNVTPALGTSENVTLKQLLEGALEEYKTDYQPMFIPLNIRANHWVALYILQHEGNEYAVYKDSLGSTQYKSEREQVEELIKEYNPDIIFKYHSGQEQEDGSSCGIFALQNIKIMSEQLSALADSRDAILSSSDNWHSEIIATILKLLEHKKLTEKFMQILALAVDSSNPEPTHKLMQLLETNIKANNIIKECRHAYPDSYSKLSPYLIDRVDNDSDDSYEDTGIDDSEKLSKSLELISYLHEQVQAQFPDYHITNLDEIIKYLEPYQGNQQFVEDVLIKELIKKADSPDEYCQFLALLNGSEVLESVIIKYIGSKDIKSVTELIEKELLSKHIDEVFAKVKVADHSAIADITAASIRQYVLWLKDNGWSCEGVVKLLGQIYKDDISVTAEILSGLKKYKIGEEESNRQGQSALDIINQYMDGEVSSLADIEKAIHEIFINKFETKHENTGDELLAKVEELNPDFVDNFPEYQAMLNKVHDIYQEADESRSTAISKWNKDDIKEWADAIKSKYQHQQQESPDAGSVDIAEMIAVIQRAYKLHTANQGKEGHNLRDSQIVSLILLLEEYQGISIDPGNKGRLMQIATGEGKSIISASLAAILSLLGRRVDIITSSTVLAAAGYKNAVGFFEILGLSANINTGYGEGSGEKPCYGSDIVYGDNLTSQSDLLSNTSHQNYARGARPLDVVIVDEVDSMLLDGSNNLAKQSSPVPLMEYLSKAMAISWDTYQKSIKPDKLNDDRAIDAACGLIDKLVEECPIPSHLRAYAKHQVPHWAKSLVEADRYWNEDQHYVINVNEDGKKIINPVDNSTGVTEENMVWQNGLHQFLQIKHGLNLGSEGLTSFFISNIAYFKNYQKILGMTGTLGSESSQEFLKTIYDIDLAFMPTHKDKQLIELPPIVTNTTSSHRAAICENAYLESYYHERAVLIIGKNIQDVKEICEELKHRYGNSVNVINYSRSEESLYNNQIEQSTLPKTIIVATALAGRGTDIKTSLEVEENGGLHVISTLIAKNARDEAQIIGRTARSGNSGTCCSIILDRSYNDIDSPYSGREEHIVASFKEMRDAREQEYVKESIEEKVPSILAEDELYNKFSQLYQELTDHGEDDNPSGSERQQRRAKINQLKEDFGLWLQTHSDSESIEDFLSAARAKYNEGRFTNPSYPIIGHVGCGDGAATIEHLKAAIGIDDIYNFAAHYYTAQGWLQVGPKGDKEYKAKTIESLFETQNRIAELLSYLGAMNIAVASVDGSIDKENELIRQAAAKLGFFQSFAESLEKAVTVVQTCPSNKEVRVKSAISADSLDPALDDDDTKELSFLGVSSIFEVETYKPRQKWLDTIIVGVCSIAQMAIGALIAIGSLGSGINLAVGVMVEGVKDLYATIKAAATGVAIKFTDYLTEKAISYAVMAASCGIEKISASSSAAAKGGQAAATKAGTDTVSTTLVNEAASTSTKESLKTEIIKKVVRKAGVELIKTVAIEHVVDFISEGINDGILGGLESRIEGTIDKSASNALNNNPILLSKDHNIEREQLLQEITQEISKKVKTGRNVHIISSLSSGIFSAVGKHNGIGTALYAAQKIGTVTDAASRIEPIMDDMKDIIDNVVARAASRAAERPKGRAYHRENTSGELDQAEVQVRDSMSSQIGSVVASYLMQSIQGKVTAPLVNVAVTAGANKILENYERNTQKELGILSTALAEKQMESMMHMQQQLGVTGNVEDVAGNRSIMLANAANDQAALPAIQEKTALEINAAGDKPSDESMQQIAAAINQPLYLFEDGVLKASYGKGLNGAIIAVDYDSAQNAYRNLIQQEASNYRESQEQLSRSVVYLPNIHEALASGTQGKYTALDLLQLQQANYNAAIAPSNGYRGVYDFFAPTSSSLEASNQMGHKPYVSRYSNGVSGDTGPVPLYDVAREYKTGVGQYTDSRVKQEADYPFDGGANSGSGAEGFWSRAGYVVSELFGISTAYGDLVGPEAGSMEINGSEVYTDSGVRQVVDFPFVSRSSSGSGSASFWSRINVDPDQSGAGIRVAETDFYGRYLPSPSFAVTRDNNSYETTQDEQKTVKIYDVKSGTKIDSNNHGLKKDSFVRNGKEVTSYRNSSGQFTKTPSPYNYSINTQIPLINLGGQEYSLVLIDSREITLGDTKVQTGMTAYTKSPYIFSGFNKGLNASMGWHSGILVGSAALGDGSNLSAHILETLGIAGFNVGKSGLGAKLGFKGSLANVKYIMPISEKCWIGYCFEGDATLEAGLGISAKAEIGLSNKKVKATLGGGAIAQGELSIDVSYRKNPEHILAQQKRTEQIQAKYDHFNNEIKHYPTHVIVKIAAMNIVDFSNPDDFESILTLAKTFSKK